MSGPSRSRKAVVAPKATPAPKASTRSGGVSLGDIQSEVEQTAVNLKAAQTVYVSAKKRLSDAEEAHDAALVKLNHGINSVKAGVKVNNLFAQ
jgi:hypothetical protein